MGSKSQYKNENLTLCLDYCPALRESHRALQESRSARRRKNCKFTGFRLSRDLNRPFPRSPQSLFQSESKCETFVMIISSNFNMNEKWFSWLRTLPRFEMEGEVNSKMAYFHTARPQESDHCHILRFLHFLWLRLNIRGGTSMLSSLPVRCP